MLFGTDKINDLLIKEKQHPFSYLIVWNLKIVNWKVELIFISLAFQWNTVIKDIFPGDC